MFELKEAPRARVIRQVRQWISDGTFAPGQPLPSERALAERFGVARPTVRQALLSLDEAGVTRSNGGRLRLVSGAMASGRDDSERGGLLKQTVVLLGGNAVGAGHRVLRAHHVHGGWADHVSLGALEAIEAAGLHSLLLNPDRLNEETLRHLSSDLPLGVVIPETALAARSWIEALRRNGVNVVVESDHPRFAEFDRVFSDHEAGAGALTRWMIERGKTRIAPVENEVPAPAKYWVERRRAGYRRAMQEAGLPALPPLLIQSHPALPQEHERGDFEIVARHYVGFLAPLLTAPQPVEALLAISDPLTFGLASACRLLHREPNRDVLIGGYDNYWMDLPMMEWESARPAVTIDKLNPQVGAEMVHLLRQRAGGELPAEPQCRLVAPQLVVPRLVVPDAGQTVGISVARAA